MSNTRTITLSSRKKWRNSQEWHSVHVAECGDYRREGYGPLIPGICADMAADGFTGTVRVERDGKEVFTPAQVSSWIGGLPTRGEQPSWLSK